LETASSLRENNTLPTHSFTANDFFTAQFDGCR